MEYTPTRLGNKIFEILTENGDWMTRKELATALKRPGYLGSHDQRLLQELIDAGLVEGEEKELGIVKFEYVYRVKG